MAELINNHSGSNEGIVNGRYLAFEDITGLKK